MIKPEELKDKNYKIFLGMPMYGGMLTENTMHGLLNLQQWSMARGVGMRVQSMGNESLITRARNTVVSMMMDATDYVATHLLFIDSDIGFNSQNIEDYFVLIKRWCVVFIQENIFTLKKYLKY